MVLLDRGRYSDAEGNINLTKMRRSICLPVSIKELEYIEKVLKQGGRLVYLQNELPHSRLEDN